MSTSEQVVGGTRLAYRLKEAAAAVGVRPAYMWEQLRSGAIRGVKTGSATLITADELRRWLDSLPDARPRVSPV